MILSQLTKQHLEQFAAEHTRCGRPPRAKTIQAHRLHLERFAHALDSSPIKCGDSRGVSLSVNEIKDYYLDRIAKSGVSNRNQFLTAITDFMRWLVNDNRWPKDRLDLWLVFHKKSFQFWKRGAPNHKFLRAEQLSAVMTTLADKSNQIESDRNVAFFGLIFFGPSRLGEIRLLDCEDISPPSTPPHIMGGTKGGYFTITIRPENAKNGQEQIIRLFAGSILGGIDVYSALERYTAWRLQESQTGPFFVTLYDKGIQPTESSKWRRPSSTNWHTILRRVSQKCDVKMTSHYLRHTFGELAASVLDERDLRQLYGHSSEQTTRVYTDHQNGDRLDSARRSVMDFVANY